MTHQHAVFARAVLLASACIGALTFATACGSSVEDGGSSAGGGGGSGPSTTANSSVTTTGTTATGPSSSAGGGGACGTPAPVGPVEVCGGSASASSGGEFQCGTVLCDAQNEWMSFCDNTGHCTCSFNDVEVCSCNVAPGDGCTGVGCCPAPWPDP